MQLSYAVLAAALASSALANPPPPIPTQTLPLKAHVFADPSCSRSRASLYYLSPGCTGPLFHPASSIRVAYFVPEHCTLTAYDDGRCQGVEVSVKDASGRNAGRRQKVLAGPTEHGSCYGVGDDPAGAEGNPSDIPGANSFFLKCES